MNPQTPASTTAERGVSVTVSVTRNAGHSKNLSFAERAAKNPKATASRAIAAQVVNGDRHMRNIDRPPPGDVGLARKTKSKADLAKQRSNINFFEEAFAVTETNHAKERIYGDSMVMAEVKTNVIIEDEFSFITELSYLLSTRYQRPVTSIAVMLRHSACMMYGGTVDPAYFMSIFALPSLLQPTTNKRNAALIQKHMEETLGVNPSRGLVRFVPANEEHLACNGNTVAGQIEEMEKSQGHSSSVGVDEGHSGLFRRTSLKLAVKVVSFQSFPSFRQPQTPNGTLTQPELTPPGSATGALPTVPETPTSPVTKKQPKKKKSFVAAMFGRSGSTTAATTKSAYRNSLPRITGD
ncbi:Tautomerase/MIF superfamily [Naviculisporaceae sp. PSN 640]